jgi:hypothetical protein
MTWTDLPGAVRNLSRKLEARRAERWARNAYADLDRAFLRLDMGRGPTPTSGGWEIGIELVPDPTLSGLIGWRLLLELKRMRTLHVQLETTDRVQGWTQVEAKRFSDDTPLGSIAKWAEQAIRTRFEDYVASLRHAIEVAFQFHGQDARVWDVGRDRVWDHGADRGIGWAFVVNVRSIPDRTFAIAITQHEIILKAAVIADDWERCIGRKTIVAGTTGTHIATWACDLISSHAPN